MEPSTSCTLSESGARLGREAWPGGARLTWSYLGLSPSQLLQPGGSHSAGAGPSLCGHLPAIRGRVRQRCSPGHRCCLPPCPDDLCLKKSPATSFVGPGLGPHLSPSQVQTPRTSKTAMYDPLHGHWPGPLALPERSSTWVSNIYI